MLRGLRIGRMARRFFCHSQECILYLRTVTNIDLRCSYVRIVSVLDAHMALAAPEGPNSKRLRSLQVPNGDIICSQLLEL